MSTIFLARAFTPSIALSELFVWFFFIEPL